MWITLTMLSMRTWSWAAMVQDTNTFLPDNLPPCMSTPAQHVAWWLHLMAATWEMFSSRSDTWRSICKIQIYICAWRDVVFVYINNSKRRMQGFWKGGGCPTLVYKQEGGQRGGGGVLLWAQCLKAYTVGQKGKGSALLPIKYMYMNMKSRVAIQYY